MRMLLMVALLPLAACQWNWEKKGEAAQASGSGATRSYAASGLTGQAQFRKFLPPAVSNKT